MHLAAAIMIKNEADVILYTLSSLIGVIDSLVLYDTGSTDNTINICREFATRHQIPFRLKTGTFEDFATSRNVLLTFVNSFPDIDFVLLCDANDEFQGNIPVLRSKLESSSSSISAFLIQQKWESLSSLTTYYNIRLIRPRRGWTYHQPVHEYLEQSAVVEIDWESPESTAGEEGGMDVGIPPKISPDLCTLYQNRLRDEHKTQSRFVQDRDMLTEALKHDPTNTRILFYLAQTYFCLGDYPNAELMYKARVAVPLTGKDVSYIREEVYESLCNLGKITHMRGNSWWMVSAPYFIMAYNTLPRAEPLMHLFEYCHAARQITLGYAFAKLASLIPFPSDCVLFVDQIVYDYKRWQALAMSAIYVGETEFEAGLKACEIAVQYARAHNLPSLEADLTNLKVYNERRSSSVISSAGVKFGQKSGQNSGQILF